MFFGTNLKTANKRFLLFGSNDANLLNINSNPHLLCNYAVQKVKFFLQCCLVWRSF